MEADVKPGTESRNESRIERAIKQLTSLLIPGERVEASAFQRRLFALTHRRGIVIATSGRLISVTRGLFGGFNPSDVRWQDLKDVRLRVGIFGADLMVSAYGSPDLAMMGETTRGIAQTGLGKAGAEAVYRLCQAHEQAWREKRRIRDLEELRAKSGGIQMGSPSSGAPLSMPSGQEGGDPVARLTRAKEMLDKGLITDAEYESTKARIVSGL